MIKLFLILLPLGSIAQDTVSKDEYTYFHYKQIYNSCERRYDTLNQIIRIRNPKHKKLQLLIDSLLECLACSSRANDSMIVYKPKRISWRN